MLHLGNEILKRSIRDVTDEQIGYAVLDRQEMVIWIRGFRCHPTIFVVSGTESRGFVVSGTYEEIRGFRYRVKGFVVSGTYQEIRGIGCRISGFWVPGFVVSGAEVRGF